MNVVAAVLLSLAQSSSTYDSARAAAINTCEGIDARQYQTGLFMNPEGDRSYYVQSECFQKTAVQFRDAALCEKARSPLPRRSAKREGGRQAGLHSRNRLVRQRVA